jgi:hypothetical protein
MCTIDNKLIFIQSLVIIIEQKNVLESTCSYIKNACQTLSFSCDVKYKFHSVVTCQ